MLVLQPFDSKLLNLLQTQIPLIDHPFAQIAQEAGMTEAEVLARLRALRFPQPPERPVIRQISAIFDSKSLGYQTTLVAAQIPESRLDASAAIISRHPGVSHNYRRTHAFNLWYTLAVPPHSKLGLERTLAILHKSSGAVSTRMLPTLKLYKIGVKFDLSSDGDLYARTATNVAGRNDNAAPALLTEMDRSIIRVLQQDLPLEPEPFKPWAAQAGISVSELLYRAQEFLNQGSMRRFAAVLKHRAVGISANAMGVWDVPPAQQEAFGQRASTFAAVSHCYLRTTYPDWPFSIFTMVHAPSEEQCEAVLAQISKESGVMHYQALYSTTEYKKTRVKYFTPEIDQWENQASQDR